MKRILVELDGSKDDYKALDEAIKLSALYNSELHTVSVEQLPRFPASINEVKAEKESEDLKVSQFIEKAKEIAGAQNCPIEPHILMGNKSKRINEFIRKNQIDLLVISNPNRLIKSSACSVLVVK
jgi:nucleotide-binding universal stress UspA family protein